MREPEKAPSSSDGVDDEQDIWARQEDYDSIYYANGAPDDEKGDST